MKILYNSLLLFVFLFHFVSCKKETVEPIDFSKYTSTDVSCSAIGTIDTTDWTYDTYWNATENALMYFDDNLRITDSTAGYVEVSPLCPNPNEGLFLLGINTERQCKMKMVCVNTEMETLFFTAKVFSGGPIVSAYDFRSITSFHKGTNYRMYYAFYTAADSVNYYYKGHGDFRIE